LSGQSEGRNRRDRVENLSTKEAGKTMIRDGDCLCNRPTGVTLVDIAGRRIGISGAEELYRDWLQAGKDPAGLSDEEVLASLRESNYVSSSVEGAYAEAIRSAYSRWRTRIGQPTGGGRSDAQG